VHRTELPGVFRHEAYLQVIQPVRVLDLLLRCFLEFSEAASSIGANLDVRSHCLSAASVEEEGRRIYDRPNPIHGRL